MLSRLIVLLGLLVSQSVFAADVTISLTAQGVAELVNVFGVTPGAQVNTAGVIVVDDTSTDMQVIPAGTFVPALGVTLGNSVTLIGRQAIRSANITSGSAVFNETFLVDLYWTSTPHVLAVEGDLTTEGTQGISFQVQDFNLGDIYWGGFNCNSQTGVTLCNLSADGAITDYLTGGYSLFSSATATFSLPDEEVVKTPAEQVADMKALVQSYPIKNIVKSTLNAQLVLIERVLQRNGPNATQYAIRLTKAFIDTVNFLARRGQLTTAQADELNAAATVLITTLTAN